MDVSVKHSVQLFMQAFSLNGGRVCTFFFFFTRMGDFV